MAKIYSVANTFPLKIRESLSMRFSGLLEYSATFLVEKGTASTAGFASGQVIETSSGNVTVFPGPRITQSNNNHFDEIEVTAYGKGLDFGFSVPDRTIMGTEVLELSASYSKKYREPAAPDAEPNPWVTYNWTVNESWQCETATKHSVINNESSNYSTAYENLSKLLIRRWISGENSPNGRTQLNITWGPPVNRSISRTNYGAYDEVAVTNGYAPQVS